MTHASHEPAPGICPVGGVTLPTVAARSEGGSVRARRVKRSSQVLTTLAAGLLSALAVPIASGAEIAWNNISFTNFSITPQSGTAELLIDWEIEANAEARNSLGQEDFDNDFSLFGGTVEAAAAVTWANRGYAKADAPTNFPPDVNVLGDVRSRVDVPGVEVGCGPERWAYDEGTATLLNGLIVTGGTGEVTVDFSLDFTRQWEVSTDSCDPVEAWTEFVLSLEFFDDLVGDQDQFVFFERERYECDTPNCYKAGGPITTTLTASRTFLFDTEYYFGLQGDSESYAWVPAAPTLLLTLTGLGILLLRRGNRQRSQIAV